MRTPLRTAAAVLLLLAPATAQSDELHARGRALFVERGCAHCHAEERPARLTAQSPSGPDLRRAGARLDRAWLERWLCDPRATHPQARMPVLFAGDEAGRAAARDVAAYLAGLEGPLRREEVDWAQRDGARLFVARGCAACHRLDGEPTDARHLLTGLAAKTGPVQLAGYLQHPLRHHPRGLMPDLALSRREAEALAGFLCGAPPTEPVAETAPLPERAPAPAGDAERGAALVAQKRCHACHDLPAPPSPPAAPPALAELGAAGEAGCLAAQPAGDVPRFGLRAAERAALLAFVRAPARPETGEAELQRRLAQLRCLQCHERGAVGGMPDAVRTRYHTAVQADSQDHADPPPLTDLHERLRPGWVEAVLQRRERARPYMELRMPHHAPELTAGLAKLLAGEEQAAPPADHRLEDVEHGRQLIGFGGFSCMICHDFKGRPAHGARAPDLALARRRLRPAWLRRWIVDPAAVRPGTRMPTYFQDGRSGAAHILGGDAEAQVRAILAYLAQGERATPPAGMEPVTDAVVQVKDHPRVQRTILPGLDPRSLAIGFSQGLSLAVDLAAPRLGYVWQGGFLDLSRKWTGRGDGACDLVGGLLLDGVAGSMFRRGNILFDARLEGYRLDGERVTVVFRVEDGPVELGFDVVRSEVGYGLRLTARSRWRQPVEIALGRRAAEPRVWRRGARALVELRGRAGARCWLCSEQLADDAVPRLRLPAGGEAAAILWFPTSGSETAAQVLLGWSDT